MSELGAEPELRYKDVERLLSRIFEVSSEEEGAFRARVRHLRNVGIPTELPRPGSGAPIGYTRQHLMQMIIGLELSALGIAPRHAADLTKKALRLELGAIQAQPHFSRSSERGAGQEAEIECRVAPESFPRLQMVTPAAAKPMQFLALPRFESTLEWNSLCNRLRDKSRLYLIIYPGEEFAPGRQCNIDVKELNETEVAQEVSLHLRISFVNLSSAFNALDEFLKQRP